jgi:hypothetical protein
MCRLIEPQLSAARQADGGPDAPLLPFDLGGRNALPCQGLERRVEIVAHQVEHRPQQLVVGVPLREVLAGGVDRDLASLIISPSQLLGRLARNLEPLPSGMACWSCKPPQALERQKQPEEDEGNGHGSRTAGECDLV